jgi:hypothetical protein
MISRVWALFVMSKIAESKAHRLDDELRRRQREIVTPFRREAMRFCCRV